MSKTISPDEMDSLITKYKRYVEEKQWRKAKALLDLIEVLL